MSEVKELFESMEYGPAPEAAARAREWIAAHQDGFGLLIGGEWRAADPSTRFETLAPATGEPLAVVAQAGPEAVDAAVAAARAAQETWEGLGGAARARYLYALARQIQKHARLFAVLETLDNGKPIREARDIDIPLVARHFYHHAGWAQLMDRELPGYRAVGVVGQIIPWNFPLLMLAWKVAPALAMGNTVILKPAEFTPLTALLFGEVCQSVGLPPGVVNILTGDGSTGALLVEHPDVQKIAFTGSTEVGRIIRKATAGTGKKLSLELGGKSPFVVFDDSDLDSVVEGVVDAIWFNQGQVCCAGSRILVQEGVAEALETRLKARMEKLRVGDPMDKTVDMGAIISPVQLEKIEEMVAQGEAEGASVWQPSWGVPGDGWFYPPTLCTGLHADATLAREEVFGPVVVLMTFRTPAEAIQLANNSRYGLAASVWTENLNLALDVAPALKAGTVWVNSTNLFDAASGFGGYRESGFGREGGKEGLWEYIQPARTAPATAATATASTMEEALFVLSADEPGAPIPTADAMPGIDLTPKLFIGGKQARPDEGYSLWIRSPDGAVVSEVGRGNRKDLRNGVEAAAKAAGPWSARTAHNRAQILFYLAENLSQRSAEFTDRIRELGRDAEAAAQETEQAIQRLFSYAAWADKWEGRVHRTPFRNVTLAMPEAMGVVGVVTPPAPPFLGIVSAVMPAFAMGNAVVAVLPGAAAHMAAPLYQLLEASDVPAGTINLITGLEDELRGTLADHDGVDALWYFGSSEGSEEVERRSTGNMKRTWVDYGTPRDWNDPAGGEGEEFLRQATQIKNIWVPYGE